ncbi:MAG: hypothetical protein LBV60_16590 [Streptomyces sp.]|jgi:hypothetical protein|nr:hypothetical protein [Streptomyces sp.]
MTNPADTADAGKATFSPARLIAPYLFLVAANAGVKKAPVDDRPVLFWIFVAVAAVGAAVTVGQLRTMMRSHRVRPLPGWTLFLGALLSLYCVFALYQVANGIAP